MRKILFSLHGNACWTRIWPTGQVRIKRNKENSLQTRSIRRSFEFICEFACKYKHLKDNSFPYEYSKIVLSISASHCVTQHLKLVNTIYGNNFDAKFSDLLCCRSLLFSIFFPVTYK